MSEAGNRGTSGRLANTSPAAADSTNQKLWSQARGERGDPFQRHILKPFIAAYSKFRWGEKKVEPMMARRRMRSIFSEMLAAVSRQPDDPETILSAEAGSELGQLAVLDLGCGEAYLGRWLVSEQASYLGIDSDAYLLEEAKRKARDASLSVPVQQADITELIVGRDVAGLPLLESGCGPNLVTMTGVVDHLENYRETMEALARWPDADGGAPDFIVATLNPFFFRSLLDLDRSRGDGPEVRVPVHLAVSGSLSWPFLRWPDEYERSFVDAGFHVLSSLSPSVGQLPTLPGMDIPALCGRRDASDSPEESPPRKRFSEEVMSFVESPVHVGPFILWLLRPRKRAVLLGAPELLQLVSTFENARDAEPLAAELNRLSAPGVPVLQLAPGDPIEHAGGLGGRCYIVLEGTATRWQQRPSGPPASVQRFERGDLFGEFEAGLNPVADRFKDDVTAGRDGCQLLVLERPLIDRLLAREGVGLTARLFMTLRRRMSQYSWTWIPAQTVNSSEFVPSHVARAILFALSHEAQRPAGVDPERGRLGPPVIVATAVDLSQMIYGRPGGEVGLNKCLDQFVLHGVIDYGIWLTVVDINKNRHVKWAKDLAHDIWEALVFESFEAMLGHPLPAELAKQLLRQPRVFGDKINMLPSGKGEDVHFSQQADGFLSNLLGLCGADLAAPERLRIWLANLAAVQGALYRQSRASMFVRDVALLREVASCPDTPLGNKPRNLSGGESLMEPARWIEYAEATISHVIGQLREMGRFRATGAGVGISPDVSAILMRDTRTARRRGKDG